MIVNLRKVKGQLAAHKLMCLAEANPDLDKILDGLGIPPGAAEALDLQIAHGLFKEDRFEFDSYGEAVVAFVVNDPLGEFPLDVAVVSMADPSRYGTCNRQACLLGYESLERHSTGKPSAPCPIYQNPGEWLQKRGRGLCILDPIAAAPLLAAAKCHFASSDREHARELVDSGAIPIQRLWIRERWAA
jgi:hypothetical protein